MIVDCHVHVWGELTGYWKPLRYGRVLDDGQVRQAFPPALDPVTCPPEVMLAYMDQVGVDRAWLVQHYLYGDQNALFLDAIKRHHDRLVGFAYLGPLDQPEAPDDLERLVEAGLTGLKVEVPKTRVLRPSFRFDGEPEWRLWERLNEIGRPLVLDLIDCPASDVAALTEVVDAFPRIRFVVCHLGGAPKGHWREQALLATRPNVWTDLAYLPGLCGPDEEYPFPRAQELVRWAVEHVGADKILWGTDSPGALNYGTYRQLLDFVRKHCDFLTDEQRAAILGGNAERALAGL